MPEYKKLDQNFKNQVTAKPGGEKLTACYQCGTCTAGCPVSALHDGFNPRRILRMAVLGMKEQLLSSPELWQCVQCHVCVAHCPQDVRCADIIRVLRQIAVEEGFVSKELPSEVDRLDEEMKKQRIERIRELTGRKL